MYKEIYSLFVIKKLTGLEVVSRTKHRILKHDF